MKYETIESFFKYFDNNLPKYFHIKNSKFNFSYDENSFLTADLFCKFLNNENFEKNNEINRNDNFKIKINIILSAKIPLSFIEMPINLLVSQHDLQKDKKLKLLRYLKEDYKPCGYEKKASDFTNHTDIIWNVYLIKTYKELNFFKEFNSIFKCCADFLFEKEFETFLLQNNINIGNPIRLISKIFDLKFRDYLKIKSYELKSTSIVKIFNIEFSYSLDLRLDIDFEYQKFCNLFWQLTNVDISNGIILEKINIVNKIACFDIECGLSNVERYENVNSEKLPFPTFSIGYVQCIVIYSIVLSNKYLENTVNLTLLCLAPNRIIKNRNQKIILYNNLVKTFQKYNISSDDIDYKFFEFELDLINHFFSITFQYDYLIGYNSKSFDLPYLIMRANILSSPTWFTNKFINCYSLSQGVYTSLELTARTSQNFNISTKCEKCETKINILSDKNTQEFNNNFYVTCRCQNSCILNNETIEFEQKTSKYYIEELPFTFHQDLLLKEQISKDTFNKKLETVTNFNFRQKINHIEILNDKKAKIFLKDDFVVDDLFFIGSIFCLNIKLLIFKMFNHSFHITDNIECRLVDILFYDSEYKKTIDFDKKNFNFKKIYKLQNEMIQKLKTNEKINNKKFKIVIDVNIQNEMTNNHLKQMTEVSYEELYVSVGKTSDQSRECQLLWNNEQNIIDTCTYCLIDVLLTLAIELKFHTLFDILSANFFKICPFNVLCWQPARKSTFITTEKRNKVCVDLLYNNFIIQKILNHSLEVEGVKDENYILNLCDEQTKCIYKIKSMQNLSEFINLDANTLNSNEFEFGTLGDYNPSDLGEVKKVLKNLIEI